MSTNDKDENQVPEPDENELMAALKNKDDIPILMDIVANEIKTKASQEDHLFNTLTDSIPILSDVSDLDVASAFSEGPFANVTTSTGKPDDEIVVDVKMDEAFQRIVEEETMPNSFHNDETPDVIVLSCDSEAEVANEVEIDNVSTANESALHSNDSVESGLNNAPDCVTDNALHNALGGDSKSNSNQTAALTEVVITENVSNIAMAKTTTFNQDDLQAAIEKAFASLLPNLMDEVLKELSKNTQKDE